MIKKYCFVYKLDNSTKIPTGNNGLYYGVYLNSLFEDSQDIKVGIHAKFIGDDQINDIN